MCFTLMLPAPSYAIVATDTRITARHKDGAESYIDSEGKLRQLRNAWITGTGDHFTNEMGFRALDDVNAADLPAVSAALAAVHPQSLTLARRLDPDAPEVAKHRFVLAVDNGRAFTAYHLTAAGDLAGTVKPGGYGLSFPSDVSEAEVDKIRGAFLKEAQEDLSLPAVVIAASRALCRAADITPQVSRALRVGVMKRDRHGTTNYHLAATADEILAEGAAGVRARATRIRKGDTFRPDPIPLQEIAA